MKRIIISVLAIALAFSMCLLCSCGEITPKSIRQKALEKMINEKLSYAIDVQNIFCGDGRIIKTTGQMLDYNYAALGEENYFPIDRSMIYDHYDELIAGAKKYFTDSAIDEMKAYTVDANGTKKLMDLGYDEQRLHMNTSFKGKFYVAEAKYSAVKIVDRTDDGITVRFYGLANTFDMPMEYIDGEWYFCTMIKLTKSGN